MLSLDVSDRCRDVDSQHWPIPGHSVTGFSVADNAEPGSPDTDAREVGSPRSREELAPDDGGPSEWVDALRARTNPALRIARRAPDVELFDMTNGPDPHFVLRRDSTGRYLRLDEWDRFVWNHLDGATDVLGISRAFTAEFGQMGLFRVLAAVELFDNAEMLDDGPPDQTWGPIRNALHRRTLAGRLARVNQTLLFRRWPVSGLTGFFDRTYRWGGRVFFTVPLTVITSMLIFSGTIAWFTLDHPKPSSLATGQLLIVAMVVIASLALHELGHAMAVRHFNRRVDRAGFMLMYGTPGAFVDTSDMWLGTRRQRLVVTASGPVVNLLLGSVVALVASLRSSSTLTAIASSQFLLVAANATPLLRLDGYYLLMDALGIPNLRERSFAFVGKPFAGRVREAWAEGDLLPHLSREERILLTYGTAYLAWLLLVGVAGLLVLPVRLWNTGSVAIALGSRNALGAVLAGFVITITAFGVLQLIAARSRISEMVTLLGRRIDRATRLGGLVLVIALIAVAGVVVPGLAGTRSVVAERLWAEAVPAIVCAFASFRALRNASGATGSHWRLVFGLFGAVAGMLCFAEVGALISLRGIIFIRTIGSALGFLALIAGGRLLVGSLGGSLVACWAPVLVGLLFLITPGGPKHLGALSVGCGLIAGARIMRRPFTDVRRVPDIPSTESPGGRREGAHLRRSFEILVEHLARQLAELFGESHRLQFLTAANTAAVDRGWTMWFVQSGELVDRIEATTEARAEIYRSALCRFVEIAGSTCDPAVAVDAVVEARMSLPPRLGRLIDEHLGSALMPMGRATLAIDVTDGASSMRYTLHQVVRSLSRCVEDSAGPATLERIVASVNRRSAANGWGIWCRSNGQIADRELLATDSPVAVTAGFLAVVCSATAECVGSAMTRRAVQFALDSLPTDFHAAANTMFAGSVWSIPPAPKSIRPSSPHKWPIPG